MRIVSTSLLALRSKTWLAVAMRPLAIWETTPTTMIGNTQMSTLRKMIASSNRISRTVAAPTMASARLPDSWLS